MPKSVVKKRPRLSKKTKSTKGQVLSPWQVYHPGAFGPSWVSRFEVEVKGRESTLISELLTALEDAIRKGVLESVTEVRVRAIKVPKSMKNSESEPR